MTRGGTLERLFFQSKTDFQRHLPVADLTLINVSAGFGHLEPSHVADGLFRARQGILNGFLESFCRGTDYFNFFVNVIGHGALSRGGRRKTMPKPGLQVGRAPVARPCVLFSLFLAKGKATAHFANFLYNGGLTEAPSHRAKICCCLRSTTGCA